MASVIRGSDNFDSANEKFFVSTTQSIPTAASQLFAVPHGLGQVPRWVRVVALCLTANSGYSVGDEVEPMINSVDNGNQQMRPWADATNVGYGSGSGMMILNRTNSFGLNITNNASWAIKVYASL